MCASTLRTSVGVAAGAWTLGVDLDTGLGPRRVFSTLITVAAAD
jgi:hypothetical protein